MCGSMDSLDLGDTVEYTLSKGKGNKVSAEKVTRVPHGMECLFKLNQAFFFFMNFNELILNWALTLMPDVYVFLVNGLGEDIGSTVLSGKVVRPLRSVDPSQTDYQGLIEVTEEGKEPGFYLFHFL